MPISGPIDYTDLGYGSLRARLLALAQSAFPDVAWDADAALETLLLELNAYVGAVVTKYLNNAARESRWGTAQQRRSLLSLCKLIGYQPATAVAAQHTVSFTLASVPSADVTIPAGSVVKTIEGPDAIRFQLLADLAIPTGQTTASGTVEHSSSAQDAVIATGLAGQAVTLTQTPYLDDSAVVTAANGAYAQVQHFLASTPTDRHYTVSVDDMDRATVTFGDGANGAIPSGTIAVAYKTGGGTDGNVPVGGINRIEGTFTDANLIPVRVSITNTARTRDGAERTSAAQIRELAPQALRVLDRAVAREDFEVVARGVPGVGRALALTRNEEPGIPENALTIFIVPTAGGAPSAGLCELVRAQFVQVSGYPEPPYPTLNTLLMTVQGAGYLTLDVLAKVSVRKGYSVASVAAEVRSRLMDYFGPTIRASRLYELAPEVARGLGYTPTDRTVVTNPLVDFGFQIQDVDGNPTGSFAFSDVYNLVRDTPGVLKVSADSDGLLINGVRQDPEIASYQFPKLGTVTLYNASSGDAI